MAPTHSHSHPHSHPPPPSSLRPSSPSPSSASTSPPPRRQFYVDLIDDLRDQIRVQHQQQIRAIAEAEQQHRQQQQQQQQQLNKGERPTSGLGSASKARKSSNYYLTHYRANTLSRYRPAIPTPEVKAAESTSSTRKSSAAVPVPAPAPLIISTPSSFFTQLDSQLALLSSSLSSDPSLLLPYPPSSPSSEAQSKQMEIDMERLKLKLLYEKLDEMNTLHRKLIREVEEKHEKESNNKQEELRNEQERREKEKEKEWRELFLKERDIERAKHESEKENLISMYSSLLQQKDALLSSSSSSFHSLLQQQAATESHRLEQQKQAVESVERRREEMEREVERERMEREKERRIGGERISEMQRQFQIEQHQRIQLQDQLLRSQNDLSLCQQSNHSLEVEIAKLKLRLSSLETQLEENSQLRKKYARLVDDWNEKEEEEEIRKEERKREKEELEIREEEVRRKVREIQEREEKRERNRRERREFAERLHEKRSIFQRLAGEGSADPGIDGDPDGTGGSRDGEQHLSAWASGAISRQYLY